MSFWTDIARTQSPPRAADALHVQFADKDIFVVCEASEPTSSAAQLVPVALGAIVSAVAGATSNSATRILDSALEYANRTIHDAKRFNPLVSDIIVSAAVALRDAEGLHYANVGSNALFYRSGGSTRRLNDPESESRRLVNEGITTDPLPGAQQASSRPNTGLGLPEDLFRVRQSGTLRESEDYLLVIAGGRAASRLGTVHIDTISPVGDEASTASRLLRQSGIRPEDASAICAAHRALDVVLMDGADINPPAREPREPLNIPWKAVGGAAAILALIGLAVTLYGLWGDGSTPKKDPVLSPTTLLPQKLTDDKAVTPRPSPPQGALDTGLRPLDLTVQPADLLTDSREQSDRRADAADIQREDSAVTDAPAPDLKAIEEARREAAREARRVERRRKAREARRKARAKARAEAAAREAALGEDAGQVTPEEPDVTTQPNSPAGADVIQVIDFSKPDPDARDEADVRPAKKPFPEAKLDMPEEEPEAQPDPVAKEDPDVRSSAAETPDATSHEL